jgi:hypothetical protein
VDDVHGDLTKLAGSTCATAVGTTLAAAAQLTCTFSVELAGAVGTTHTDTVTVAVVDDDGSTATADDDAVVEIVDPAATPTTLTPPTTAKPSPTTAPARPRSVPQLVATGGETAAMTVVALALIGLGLVAAGTRLRLGSRRRT